MSTLIKTMTMYTTFKFLAEENVSRCLDKHSKEVPQKYVCNKKSQHANTVKSHLPKIE